MSNMMMNIVFVQLSDPHGSLAWKLANMAYAQYAHLLPRKLAFFSKNSCGGATNQFDSFYQFFNQINANRFKFLFEEHFCPSFKKVQFVVCPQFEIPFRALLGAKITEAEGGLPFWNVLHTYIHTRTCIMYICFALLPPPCPILSRVVHSPKRRELSFFFWPFIFIKCCLFMSTHTLSWRPLRSLSLTQSLSLSLVSFLPDAPLPIFMSHRTSAKMRSTFCSLFWSDFWHQVDFWIPFARQ